MGRPAAKDLSVRGGQCLVASDQAMVCLEDMKPPPCQTQRYKKYAGRGGQEAGSDPPLDLGATALSLNGGKR